MIFKICTTEDGEVFFAQYKDEATALKDVNRAVEDRGGNAIEINVPERGLVNLVDAEYCFFIRGEIISLKPVEVVKKMTFSK